MADLIQLLRGGAPKLVDTPDLAQLVVLPLPSSPDPTPTFVPLLVLRPTGVIADQYRASLLLPP